MPDYLQRIWAVTSKEFLQLGRDKLTFAMVFGVPLMQIILFGYAINMDVRHLDAGVVDLANTSLSRAIIANAQASQLVDITARLDSEQALEREIRSGRLGVGIIIPADLERRVQLGDRPVGQIIVDGSDPVVGGIAAQLGQIPPLMRATVGDQPSPRFAVSIFFNPEGRSAVNIVPALIGIILIMTMVLFTSIAIVRERERGNLELLITTPIKTSELMTGKILPYIFIGLLQTTLILITGVWMFDVPINGSLTELYIACLLFIAANLALGLMISNFATTQFQAVQMMIFTLMPSILLSGFMFPFEGMPLVAQWIGLLFPATHFMEMARGIVLRGAHLNELTTQWVILLIFFFITMSIAIGRFRKRLD